MGVNLSADIITFFASFLTGLLGGIIFDSLKVLGLLSKRKTLIISLYDIIFSLSFCLLITVVFYIFNSFELRWFMFIALVCGMILYKLLISSLYICAFRKIISIILIIFNFIFKILLTPTRFLYKILLVYLVIPIKILVKNIISFLKNAKLFDYLQYLTIFHNFLIHFALFHFAHKYHIPSL